MRGLIFHGGLIYFVSNYYCKHAAWLAIRLAQSCLSKIWTESYKLLEGIPVEIRKRSPSRNNKSFWSPYDCSCNFYAAVSFLADETHTANQSPDDNWQPIFCASLSMEPVQRNMSRKIQVSQRIHPRYQTSENAKIDMMQDIRSGLICTTILYMLLENPSNSLSNHSLHCSVGSAGRGA